MEGMHEGRGAGRSLTPETEAVLTYGASHAHRPLNAPLFLSTQWEAADLSQLADLFTRDPDRGFYTRFGHPTVRVAEEKLARLEGAEDALLFASGMAAISTALHAVLRSGDHVVAHRAIFGQTIQLLDHLAEAFGVEVVWVDATAAAEVQAALRPTTRLLYLETPSNPLLDIQDIEWLTGLAHDRGAMVFVDSTFAGPLIQRPLSLGADLVLHSGSKSLGGHADVLAGAAAGSEELIGRIRAMRVLHGPSLDPHAAWLLIRSMQTLPLRVRAQSESAMAVAEMLDRHPAVTWLRYPLLPTHPGCEVARRQMARGGNMVSFSVTGGLDGARRLAGALEWISVASSLGSVFTTLEVPEELDFAVEEIGSRADGFAMPPGLIRLSVGAEALTDIQEELARGLAAASRDEPPAPTRSSAPVEKERVP